MAQRSRPNNYAVSGCPAPSTGAIIAQTATDRNPQLLLLANQADSAGWLAQRRGIQEHWSNVIPTDPELAGADTRPLLSPMKESDCRPESRRTTLGFPPFEAGRCSDRPKRRSCFHQRKSRRQSRWLVVGLRIAMMHLNPEKCREGLRRLEQGRPVFCHQRKEPRFASS